MFGHTALPTYIAASINLVREREKLTRQMPKLAGKCPVTDCYYEHWSTELASSPVSGGIGPGTHCLRMCYKILKDLAVILCR